jgi:hypothetical protein
LTPTFSCVAAGVAPTASVTTANAKLVSLIHSSQICFCMVVLCVIALLTARGSASPDPRDLTRRAAEGKRS